MENVKTIIVVAPDGSKKNVEPQPKLKFRDKDFVLKSDGESALRIESPVIGIKPEKPQLETVCALIDNWMNKRVWRLTSAKGANFDFASGDEADVAYVEVVAPNGRPSDADVTDVKTKILDWLKSLSTRTPKPEAEKPAAPAAAAAPAAPAAPAAAPAAEKPAEEKPAAPAAPKPEDKPAAPAAEKPAEEKPAAPAAEKPAEDKPAAPAEPPKGKTWKELEDEGKSIDEILDYFMGK